MTLALFVLVLAVVASIATVHAVLRDGYHRRRTLPAGAVEGYRWH